VVLAHHDYPRRRRDAHYDEGWKQHRALSAAPNVQYKISEIGMGDPR
jgi:predicted TIM-barrel fold metal-dependent hydrolase